MLTYPLPVASLCRSCSSVPSFAVRNDAVPMRQHSLSSLSGSLLASLRLTNWLHQLASERLSLSGINWYLRYQRPYWAHTLCIINGAVRSKFVVLVFKQHSVLWDRPGRSRQTFRFAAFISAPIPATPYSQTLAVNIL